MSGELGARQDRHLAPGTKVRRDAYWDGSDELTSEFGVVIHCWLDDETGMFDCYIAFFGDALPSGKPAAKPYILRYASVSLTEIEAAGSANDDYELVMGSDVADRDGMYLELNDGSMQAMPLAEVFHSDLDGSMTVSTFGNTIPLDAMEWMVAEAKRRLPPRQ